MLGAQEGGHFGFETDDVLGLALPDGKNPPSIAFELPE
jgi:hypothetical protein